MKDQRKKEFAKIYVENINPLFRFVNSKLYNKERSEEITSKVIEVAYEKYMADEKLVIENPKAWLFKIAQLTMSNSFRKKKYDLPHDPEIEFEDKDLKLEDAIVDEERVKEIKEAFGELDPDTRQVISLKVWEDMQFNEIAENMEINESTAKSLYYRGVTKVKKILEEREIAQLSGIIVGLQKIGTDRFFEAGDGFVNNLLDKIDPQLALLVGAGTGGIAAIAAPLIAGGSKMVAAGAVVAGGGGKLTGSAATVAKGITIFGKAISVKEAAVAAGAAVVVSGAAVGSAVIIEDQIIDSKHIELSTCFQVCDERELMIDAIAKTEGIDSYYMILKMDHPDGEIDSETHYEVEDPNRYYRRIFWTYPDGRFEEIREEIKIDELDYSRSRHDGVNLSDWEKSERDPMWNFITVESFSSIVEKFFYPDTDSMRIDELVELGRTESERTIRLVARYYPYNTDYFLGSWGYIIKIDSEGYPISVESIPSVDKSTIIVSYQFSGWGEEIVVEAPQIEIDPNLSNTIIVQADGFYEDSPITKFCLEDIYTLKTILCEDDFIDSGEDGYAFNGFFEVKLGAYYLYAEYENDKRKYFTNRDSCETYLSRINCYDDQRMHNKDAVIVSEFEVTSGGIKISDEKYNECLIDYLGNPYCDMEATSGGDPETFATVWVGPDKRVYSQEFIDFSEFGEQYQFGIKVRIPAEGYGIRFEDLGFGKVLTIYYDQGSRLVIYPFDKNKPDNEVLAFDDLELVNDSFIPGLYRSDTYERFDWDDRSGWFIYDNSFSTGFNCGIAGDIVAPCGFGRITTELNGNRGEFVAICTNYLGYESGCDELIMNIERWY